MMVTTAVTVAPQKRIENKAITKSKKAPQNVTSNESIEE